jgi:hypothetical protein
MKEKKEEEEEETSGPQDLGVLNNLSDSHFSN